MRKGYIHVYTGPGKGKTTAAIGLGIRSAGAGYKVYMIQFMKGRRYNELKTISKIPNFRFAQHGRDEFVNKDNPAQIDIDLAREGLEHARDIAKKENYDILILDEINVAVDYNLIDINDVLTLIKEKPEKLELVLTGRNAHPEIVKIADYVTEMLEIKHPYQQGVQAREGIGF